MKMMSYGVSNELPNCCGVVEFGEFIVDDDSFGWGWQGDPIGELRLGRSDLGCAAFIDSDECRLAYEKLKDRFNIAYQSSVRKNKGSGNELFFVVYDGIAKATPRKGKK